MGRVYSGRSVRRRHSLTTSYEVCQGCRMTRAFLLRYLRLWTQDGARRLGYAMDTSLIGRDLAAELTRRLPTMTKSDVDHALRKHIHPDQLAVVLVGTGATQLQQVMIEDRPTTIVYDTKDTPPEILREDEVIARHPLKIRKVHTKIVSASALFEK